MHRVVEHAERAAEVLDHALQPEADAEDGHAALHERLRSVPDTSKSRGVPGPGDSTTRSGASVVERVARESRARSVDHLGARLAQVVGQRVHERVLVVDEQDALARARAAAASHGLGGGRRAPARRMASRNAEALSCVSRSSSSGSES